MQRLALKTHLHMENVKKQGILAADDNQHARKAMNSWESLHSLLAQIKERVGRRIKWFK